MSNSINKSITINTLTPTYDKVEDRIRLSINYQDLNNRCDVMITRSFILQILPAIEEYIYKHYPNEPILEDDEIQINSSSSQKDNSFSQTQMEDIELYKNLEDLLITLNLHYHQETQLTILSFITKENYNLSLNCNVDMLKNILKAIKKSIPVYSWNLVGLV